MYYIEKLSLVLLVGPLLQYIGFKTQVCGSLSCQAIVYVLELRATTLLESISLDEKLGQVKPS